jgi:hypothetical protein
MTKITQPTAMRRFEQGLQALADIRHTEEDSVKTEVQFAVVAIMAYLGAYAFPKENLYGLKQKLRDALADEFTPDQIERVIDRAVDVAECFRRPWEESGSREEPTI